MYNNRPIIIEAAMECERNIILSALADPHEISLYGYPAVEGLLDGFPLIVARNCTGMVNAAILTTLLIEKYHPRCVISEGTAGSHVEELHPGDMVLGERVRNLGSLYMDEALCREIRELTCGEWDDMRCMHSDGELLKLAQSVPYSGGQVVRGLIGTGDFWSRGRERIDMLHERYESCCEEMESFGVASACSRMGVPFLALRVISNNELTGEAFCETAAEDCQRYTVNVAKRIFAADRENIHE